MSIEEDIARLQREQERMRNQIDGLFVFARDMTMQAKTLAHYAMWMTLALRQSGSPVDSAILNAARELDRYLQAQCSNNRYWDLLLADLRPLPPSPTAPHRNPGRPTLVTPEWLAAHIGDSTPQTGPDPTPEEPAPPPARP